jgi:cation:H+ antiporter
MSGWPAWGTGAAFVVAAAVVWVAGSRIAGYADAIADATGLGRAVLGMLLLGGVTSLPELAVASTASIAGHPALSVNDVLGSAAINVLIIALADALIGRDAITSVLASPRVLLQGVLGIVLLGIAAAATVSVPLPFLGASAWTWLLFATYLLAVRVIARSRSGEAWRPARPGKEAAQGGKSGAPLRPLIVRSVLAAAAVLVGGFFLTKSGEALAQQTGLGTNFFGAVVLAAATSLPEISTVAAAVRLGRYEMALSDIFGTNLFNMVILFVADLLYAGPPVLAEVGAFAGVGALLALVLTAIFLVGLIERRDRTVARMGWDSLTAIVVYLAGLGVLYQLK